MNRLTFTKEFKKHEEIGHILCLKPEKLIEWEEKLSQYEDIGEPKELIKRPSLDENGLAQCGCGGKVRVECYPEWAGMSKAYQVDCFNCHVGTMPCQTAEQAKIAWNTAMGWRAKE